MCVGGSMVFVSFEVKWAANCSESLEPWTGAARATRRAVAQALRFQRSGAARNGAIFLVKIRPELLVVVLIAGPPMVSGEKYEFV